MACIRPSADTNTGCAPVSKALLARVLDAANRGINLTENRRPLRRAFADVHADDVIERGAPRVSSRCRVQVARETTRPSCRSRAQQLELLTVRSIVCPPGHLPVTRSRESALAKRRPPTRKAGVAPARGCISSNARPRIVVARDSRSPSQRVSSRGLRTGVIHPVPGRLRIQPVAARQRGQKNDVERLGVEAEERPFARQLGGHLVAFAFEAFPQCVGNLLLVLDDQYPHRNLTPQ